MNNEIQNLQNFADNFNFKVVEKIHEDKRKKTGYFLTENKTTISPILDYDGINHFLLGVKYSQKKEGKNNSIDLFKKPLQELFTKTIPEINDKIIANQIPEKFARKCDATGEGMNEGFCFRDGERYFKYKKDAKKYAKEIGYSSLQEAYVSDAYYHTSWNEILEEEDEWYDADGKMYTNCNKCKEITIVSDDFYFCTNCLTHL